MSTDRVTNLYGAGLGWPETRTAAPLPVEGPGLVGWPPTLPRQITSAHVSRETDGDVDGVTGIDDEPNELTGAAAAVVPRETRDAPAPDEPRRARSHARVEADVSTALAPVAPASGAHRRFDATDAAELRSPYDAPISSAPAEGAADPASASPEPPRPRPVSVFRTAAEIAAIPGAIGGSSSASDPETPLAAATGMALRAQGIDRSSSLPRPPHTRVMVVANQKGGVGKTTSAVNVAAALALYGSRVLLVDLDPQGNASTALGIEHHAGVPSMYDVLVRGTPMAEVIQPAVGLNNLVCAPATIDLSGAEVELVAMVAREQRLKRAIQAHLDSPHLQGESRYDYVLIDCPPSLGLLTVNALAAGVEVFIPIQCEYYALEGVSQLVRIVDLVRSQLNPALVVTTVLLTMYDGRTRLSSQVADEVRKHFGPLVLATAIPRSVRVSEAPSYSQSVMTYDPGSTGALSYLEAAREIAYASNRIPVQEAVS